MTRPLTVLIALCATGLWLGLAVLGWGGVHAFLASPARVALVVVTVLLTLASSFTQGNLSAGEQEDRGNRWVLWLFLVVGGWTDGFPPTATGWACSRSAARACAGPAWRCSRSAVC